MRATFFTLIILILVIGGAFYYYFNILPERLSHALITDDTSKPLPQKIIKKGKSMGIDVLDQPEKVREILVKKKLDTREVVEFVDKIEYKQVEEFMEKTKSHEIDSAEMAFNFLKENIDFGDFPIDDFKDEFHRYYDSEKMNAAMEFYEKNKEQMPVLYPVVKQTIIKYLEKLSDSTKVEE